MKITNVPEKWEIAFTIEPMSLKHEILEIRSADGGEVLSAYLHGNGVIEVVARFNKVKRPLVLYARYDGAVSNAVELKFITHRLELYVNGILHDEEWPLGAMELDGGECAICPPEFALTPADDSAGENVPFVPKKVDIKAFRPDGHNVYAGDCMPFDHDGTYHLFYLYDRRRHSSKYGLGAHQWAHLATRDLIDWYEYPMAIAIDEQFEGSICTGSFICNDGVFYAFYAVRMSDGSPAKITYSTSPDCVNFTKSGKILTLTDRYDQASARDPKVFKDADGLFHMIVTTSVNDSERLGALAHLTSENLVDWTEAEKPFVTVDDRNQPECPDYFKYGEWYYLIYSLMGQARYRISKSPFDGWIKPRRDTIGTVSLRVPKIARLGDRMVAAGFIPVMSDGYGGEISLLEVAQESDGSLSFGLVKELL